MDVLNKLKVAALAGDRERLDQHGDQFSEQVDRVQEVCRLLHHVSCNPTLQAASKAREQVVCVYGAQLLTSAQRLSIHPASKSARDNLQVFLDLWLTLYSDVQQLSRDVSELLRERSSSCFQTHSAMSSQSSSYGTRSGLAPKHVTIQTERDPRDDDLYDSPDHRGHPCQTVPPGGGGHNSLQCNTKPPIPLDSDEQSKIAQTGLEMKEAANEVDAQTGKCADPEDNDIVRRAKQMSTMAFSMYQFTRGEGELKTTQDLFTQAEFFAEEANKFYKVVRVFTYQVSWRERFEFEFSPRCAARL